MATQTGTLDIGALRAARFVSAKKFGLDTINEVLQRDLDVHNEIMMDMLGSLCEITTDAQRIYGTSASGEMVEVDEYGRGPTQRPLTGVSVGFPLRSFQYAIGWTEKWMETKTPGDMADNMIAAQEAHKRSVQLAIKKAVFLSANYTFADFLVDNIDVFVKRLVNADGANIPDGPNGEVFDGSTHTHYNATADLAASDLTAAIDTVVEHGHGAAVKVAIARADEAAVRALTGFVAYLDPRLSMGTFANEPGTRLDISRLDNRAIGLFGAAEVWVKPWAIASYPFAWDAGTPNKPLAFRQRAQDTLQGLRIAATNSSYPLTAQYMESEYGIGVWTRTNGSVLYTGGADYTDPTL